ncbi:MAG: glycoside hydrolase family 3 C-terminal domain-containing protein [Clostridiaceae bacterium]|nr:glycoside hydrolase family 3 C-terminal domain-containing protein [Clostridiaceae bacterium]
MDKKYDINKLIRQSACEGAVLLKNDGLLPFDKGTKLSLFSRVSEAWFFRGVGSGGTVRCKDERNLTVAVRECEGLELNEELAEIYSRFNKENPVEQIDEVFNLDEMEVTFEIAKRAAEISDAAVVTIGRHCGEGHEGAAEKGCYYLTDKEIRMLRNVCDAFDKVAVIINCCAIIDMSEFEKLGDKIGAIMYVWLGGNQPGDAVCDMLSGKVSPSGKLVDTIAHGYTDYPSSANFGGRNFNYYKEDIYVGYRYFETFAKDKVAYPFGFGLTYTEFEYSDISAASAEGGFDVSVTVKNVGSFPAKETAQVYLEKPCGKLGNPSRSLVAFGKTKELAPNESETLTMFVSDYQLTSYDDSGVTGYPFAYVTEQGEYNFYVGKNVRDAEKAFSYYQEKTELFVQLTQAGAPQQDFDVICAEEKDGKRVMATRPVTTRQYSLRQRILDNLPEAVPFTGDRGIKLKDVKDGKNTLDEFVAQLTVDELDLLTRGDYHTEENLKPYGGAGGFGGVTKELIAKGVPLTITCDGPAGVTLDYESSLIPSATLLACTYNEQLVEKLHCAVAEELKERLADVFLAPALNIHRNPICGRNFEYYSEDPLISGRMAAAAVRGSQSLGGSACIKHFACNNQEYNRTRNDSRLSERALREIYLKGFEIAVKESEPKNLMTSYNLINGVWGHYNYDLVTVILRGEWGYKGSVMTDWFIQYYESPDFENIWNNAYRIRGGIDLYMPGAQWQDRDNIDKSIVESYNSKDGITLGELQRCAKHILSMIIEIKY